jgi:phosphoribosylaminoimidazole-succinocarboxamide synthase
VNEPAFPLVHQGKVRDLYEVDDGRLLMVASDRISAFDVVMNEPIPDKGRVLTAMSAFWFEALAPVAGNHLVSTDLGSLPPGERDPWREGRSMLVRRCAMVPVECVVRGYLAGSGWKEYQAVGKVCGVRLPPGLREADRLPKPIFTPTTKAPVGTHDEAMTFDDVVAAIGGEQAEAVRSLVLAAYRKAAAHTEHEGILLADTKFELGVLDGELVLADEVLTPDSSRFWPADAWQPGTAPPSFDKQPVRDELEASGWGKVPPPPPLSPATVAATRQRYVEAYERLSGCRFADWPGSGGTS